jgi:hypothetical protein
MFTLLKAWVDIPLIKGGLHHASGALAAAATFRGIGWGIEKCVSEALIRLTIQRIEGMVLVTIYGFLALQLVATVAIHSWRVIKDVLHG